MPDVIRVVLSVDTSRGIVAMKRLGDESAVTSDKIIRKNEEAGASFKKVHEGSEKASHSIGMMAGAVGLGGLAFGIKDAITAAQRWQTQAASLNVSLKNVGAGGRGVAKSLMDAAEQGSTHGGFAGPEELNAIQKFVMITRSGSQAIRDNTITMNLARGQHIDYSRALLAVTRAEATGTIGRLGMYLPGFTKVTTAVTALSEAHKVNVVAMANQAATMGKAGASWLRQQALVHGVTAAQLLDAQTSDKNATKLKIMTTLQGLYGGQMAKYSRTSAGGMSNLKNSIDILAKTVGTVLLPIFNKAVVIMSKVADFLQKHKTLALALIVTLTALGVTWAVVSAATAVWTAVTTAGTAAATAIAFAVRIMTLGNVTLVTSFEALTVASTMAWIAATAGLVLVIAAVVLVVTHFRTFKGVIVDIWHWIQGAWGAVEGFFAAPVNRAVKTMSNDFRAIKRVVSDVIDWIVGAFRWLEQKAEAIIGKILGPIKAVAGVIGTVGGGIGKGIGAAAHFLFGNQGGLVPQRMASGGPVGGYPTGKDTQMIMATPGEYVLSKPAVQRVGSSYLNAINTAGSPASAGPGSGGDIPIVIPISLKMGSRVVSEEVVHHMLRRGALG